MMRTGAHFSEDRKYRYALWRIWDEQKPVVMFVGLNPSTANEKKDDPTIRRVAGFARDWGYGGFYMMNLFGYVSAYPDDLLRAGDPVGENDEWLTKIAGECEMICFVWGAFPQAVARAKKVIEMLGEAFCIGTTAAGHPRHPLYLPGNSKPVPFTPINNQ